MARGRRVVALEAVLEVEVVEPCPQQLRPHPLGNLRALVLDLVQCRQVGAETGVAHLDAAELTLDAVELALGRACVAEGREPSVERTAAGKDAFELGGGRATAARGENQQGGAGDGGHDGQDRLPEGEGQSCGDACESADTEETLAAVVSACRRRGERLDLGRTGRGAAVGSKGTGPGGERRPLAFDLAQPLGVEDALARAPVALRLEVAQAVPQRPDLVRRRESGVGGLALGDLGRGARGPVQLVGALDPPAELARPGRARPRARGRATRRAAAAAASRAESRSAASSSTASR